MSDRKSFNEVAQILANVRYPDRAFILISKGDGFLLQIAYMDSDVESGMPALQKSRKWYVSPFMTETEIVETAWAALQRSVLHEAGEKFTYKNLRIYSPHFHIDARVNSARDRRFDRRG